MCLKYSASSTFIKLHFTNPGFEIKCLYNVRHDGMHANNNGIYCVSVKIDSLIMLIFTSHAIIVETLFQIGY